jgi:hypothetical protein
MAIFANNVNARGHRYRQKGILIAGETKKGVILVSMCGQNPSVSRWSRIWVSKRPGSCFFEPGLVRLARSGAIVDYRLRKGERYATGPE